MSQETESLGETPAYVEHSARGLLTVWCQAQDRVERKVPNSQLRMLEVIMALEPVGLQRLGRELGLAASSASRLCDRLAAAGLVERAESPHDRRRVSVRLAPEGKHLLTELSEVRRGHLREVLVRMSPSGREALLRGLAEFTAVASPDRDQADERPRAGGWPSGADL
jgi:DNA-binding MarR family transcriptional regulator